THAGRPIAAAAGGAEQPLTRSIDRRLVLGAAPEQPDHEHEDADGTGERHEEDPRDAEQRPAEQNGEHDENDERRIHPDLLIGSGWNGQEPFRGAQYCGALPARICLTPARVPTAVAMPNASAVPP